MRIYHIVISLLFFLFAIAQWNDPDPWWWISWYMIVAALSGLAATGRFYKLIALFGLALSVAFLIRLLPDFMSWLNDGMPTIVGSMKAESPYIELVREFLGLLLSAVAFGILFWEAKKIEKLAE